MFVHSLYKALLVVAIQAWSLVSCEPKCKSLYSLYGHALQSSAYETSTTDGLGMCYEQCLVDEQCSSVNYDLPLGKCDLNHVTNTGFPSRLVRRENSVYAETREPGYGSAKHLSVSSCKRILDLHPDASSGIYWISPGNGSTQSPPFQVHCDMTTDGGGWTLVYSYRFTNFANFIDDSNALTPIPNFPVDWSIGRWTPVSKTVPLNETSYSAMDYPLWKKIGNEFLIKSNITHWVACSPGIGDLVNWKAGTINCKVVKNVAKVCLDYAPTNLILVSRCGAALFRNGDYSIYLEGNTQYCFPAHDSCGKRSASNHLTNGQSPGGTLYIR